MFHAELKSVLLDVPIEAQIARKVDGLLTPRRGLNRSTIWSFVAVAQRRATSGGADS